MTFTPDKPDWTDYSAIAADQRLIASALAQPSPQAIPLALQPTDRAVIVLAFGAPGNIVLDSLIGATTGVDWSIYARVPGFGTISHTPTVIPIFGSLDATATLNLHSTAVGGNITYYVVAVPDPVILGLPLTPLQVESQEVQVTPTSVACPSGAATTVLPNPATGLGYRIKEWGWAGVAATVAGAPRLVGLVNGIVYVQQNVAVGQLPTFDSCPDMVILEGIQMANATGVPITVSVNAYTVSLA